MNFKQYEIWTADLNPRFGTEAGKTRPVLIVQTDLLNKVHPSTIICPLTTNIKKGTNILRLNLKKGQASLQRDSAIMIDQIRSIDNKRFVKKIGELPKNLLPKLKDNIGIILDLD